MNETFKRKNQTIINSGCAFLIIFLFNIFIQFAFSHSWFLDVKIMPKFVAILEGSYGRAG